MEYQPNSSPPIKRWMIIVTYIYMIVGVVFLISFGVIVFGNGAGLCEYLTDFQKNVCECPGFNNRLK